MTGAEALQKIIDTVDALKTTVDELKISVQLIEANIKTLNNRAAGLMRESQSTGVYPAPNGRLNHGIRAAAPIQKLQPTQASAPSRGRQLTETPEEQRHESMDVIKEDGNNILTYKKVFGRLINNTDEPLESVLVKIYDRNNEVCATAETDPIGYFETMLKPGRYVAEYVKTGFKTTNKTFEVGRNAKEVEIK